MMTEGDTDVWPAMHTPPQPALNTHTSQSDVSKLMITIRPPLRLGKKWPCIQAPQKLYRAVYKVMILVVGIVYIISILLGRAWLQNKARRELPW